VSHSYKLEDCVETDFYFLHAFAHSSYRVRGVRVKILLRKDAKVIFTHTISVLLIRSPMLIENSWDLKFLSPAQEITVDLDQSEVIALVVINLFTLCLSFTLPTMLHNTMSNSVTHSHDLFCVYQAVECNVSDFWLLAVVINSADLSRLKTAVNHTGIFQLNSMKRICQLLKLTLTHSFSLLW